RGSATAGSSRSRTVRRRPDAAAHRFGYDPSVPLPPVLESLRQARAVAVLRTPHAEAAAPALRAVVRGGFRVVEVTLNTPEALERISDTAGPHRRGGGA